MKNIVATYILKALLVVLACALVPSLLVAPAQSQAKASGATPELDPVRLQSRAPSPVVPQVQTGTIEGTVTDSTSGEPLPGVNVVIEGTQQGASTDGQGQYTISGVEAGTYTLQASFVGYATEVAEDVEVEADATTEINFAMQPSTVALDEVVAVGYGEQERGSISSAVSEISAAEIVKKNPTDVRQALQGVAPGVSVLNQGGAPGQGNIDIKIRGITTIGNNSPLVLVNGIEQDFSEIDPNNIESISVLKDASATAIYGSRGANGVVLVTTKSPEAGDLKVSYDAYVGIEMISQKPEHLGLEAYMRLENAVYANQPGGEPIYSEEEIQEYVNTDDRLRYPLPNTFFDAAFSPGPVQDHSLSVSGGTGQLSARLALNYANQEGIMPNHGVTRKSGRLDTDFLVSDRIRVIGRLTYRRTDNLQPYDLSGTYRRLLHGSQWTVPKYPDGTYGLSDRNVNPLMAAEMSGDRTQSTDYFVTNLKAEADLLKNLKYTLQLGGHNSLATNGQFSNQFTIHDYYTDEVLLETGVNSLNEYRSRDQQWIWRNLLNYDLALNKNQLEFLAGYEQTWGRFEWMEGARDQFYSNRLRVLNAGSQENWSNSGEETETRLRSVFGRVRYSHADRYILEANARYDGSSKFNGSNNQYSFFPSFSAAWRVSNESFWEPLSSAVSSLKLRGSWGKTGNNTVDLYTFFRGINIGTNYIFSDRLVRTAALTGLVNRDLTWENTTQTDIGLDAEFLEGIFGLTFDYYWKRTEDILLTLPIPEVIGLEAPPQNAGRVDNTGWELSVTHRNTVSENFSYSVTANLSDFRNEVVDLARTGPYTNNALYGAGGITTVTKVGEPLDALWGYEALGYFQSEEEIANSPTFAGKDQTFPGDLKYADRNGDGQITPDDKTVIGVQDPHYSFGITTAMNFKSFDLSFFVQGVGKQDRLPSGAIIEGAVWGNFTLDILGDYWTPENRDARAPRPQRSTIKNTRPSSWWVVDGAYVKLKNAQLGYTLPSGLTDRVGVNRLRIYVSGTDLLTLSGAKKWGLDPEFPSGRLAYYPQASRYTVGVNLNF